MSSNLQSLRNKRLSLAPVPGDESASYNPPAAPGAETDPVFTAWRDADYHGIPAGGAAGEALVRGVGPDYTREWQTLLAHAASHKHGGTAEIATATPTANAIPKALTTGKLDAGWIPATEAGGVIRWGDRDTILATTPASPEMWQARSASGLVTSLYWDGSRWWESSEYWEDQPYFQGARQPNSQGYTKRVITNKRLHHCTIGEAETTVNRTLRCKLVDGVDRFQIRLNGDWQSIAAGVDMVVGAADVYVMNWAPWTISMLANTGNSLEIDLTGYPAVQGMRTSQGARNPLPV